MSIRITPLDNSGKLVELSANTNIYEKQVLPYGEFGYKGTKFTITPEWADEAIRAFNEQAFDQTVFALADENNSHDVDNRPDRYGGEVLGFKKTTKGVNAVIKLTSPSVKLVEDTEGKLGVSVRFRENYTREADGKSWPVVIDQVLGTLDPRLTGMDKWKAITLSNVSTSDQSDVKDSSNEEWNVTKPTDNDQNGDKNKTDKPDDGNNNSGDNNDKVTLTKDEYSQFQALLVQNAKDKADLDKILNDAGVDDKSDKKEPVKLSHDQSRIVELSFQVAESRFDRDALAYKQAGVPPKIIELAKPVLASYDPVRVVTLSNGTQITSDAREVVKNILEECKGIVNLSSESGHENRGNGTTDEFKKLYETAFNEASKF